MAGQDSLCICCQYMLLCAPWPLPGNPDQVGAGTKLSSMLYASTPPTFITQYIVLGSGHARYATVKPKVSVLGHSEALGFEVDQVYGVKRIVLLPFRRPRGGGYVVEVGINIQRANEGIRRTDAPGYAGAIAPLTSSFSQPLPELLDARRGESPT